MTDFSEFIKDTELVDLGLKDGKYTQEKGGQHDSARRLDRILISDEMDGSFRYINQSVLQRVTSDHNLIMLQCGD